MAGVYSFQLPAIFLFTPKMIGLIRECSEDKFETELRIVSMAVATVNAF